MAGGVHLQLSRLRGHGADLPVVHRRRNPSAPRAASKWPRTVPAIAPFLVALVPAVAWQIAYPDRFTELLNGYRVPGSGDTLGASLAGILRPDGLRMRIDLFWSFFSPSFLFISGDSSVINSTRAIGLLSDRVRRAHTGWPRSDCPRTRMARARCRRSWRVFHRAGRGRALR